MHFPFKPLPCNCLILRYAGIIKTRLESGRQDTAWKNVEALREFCCVNSQLVLSTTTSTRLGVLVLTNSIFLAFARIIMRA